MIGVNTGLQSWVCGTMLVKSLVWVLRGGRAQKETWRRRQFAQWRRVGKRHSPVLWHLGKRTSAVWWELDFPGGSDGKEFTCNVGDLGSIPGSRRSPGEGRKWLPTPAFLPGEFHWQKSLEGYNPCDSKELDMTEWLRLSLHTLFSI